jgi:hypothetical protein
MAISNVDFAAIDQLLIRYSARDRLEKRWEFKREYVTYLQILRRPMFQ